MRNIEKAIKDYRKYNERTDRGHFYCSDFDQLFQTAITADGYIDTWELIGNALHAGFTIGYRTAKADAKRK